MDSGWRRTLYIHTTIADKRPFFRGCLRVVLSGVRVRRRWVKRSPWIDAGTARQMDPESERQKNRPCESSAQRAIYSQSKAEIGSSPTPLPAEACCFFASFRLASAFALSALSAA
jgi:hypothetical protein